MKISLKNKQDIMFLKELANYDSQNVFKRDVSQSSLKKKLSYWRIVFQLKLS